MQVYKLYFKILKKALPSLLIYIGIFITIMIFYSLNARDNNEKMFRESKVKIAFFNHDEETKLIQGFKDYLSESCTFVDINDNKDDIQDALFFREVSYILIIPKGFTDQFLAGEEVNLEKLVVPDSTDATFVDISINNYLNTSRLYTLHGGELSQEDMVKYIKEDLETEVSVNIHSENKKANAYQFFITYYNYIVYAMLSALILGIGAIMVSFTKLDIRRRNRVAPISSTSLTLQQLLGNLTYMIALYVILIILGFVLNKEIILDRIMLLFMLNALIFSITSLSIAHLIGIVVKSKDATNGIANIIGMGSCFISGVFVPREYLGDTVLNIARFTPAYWYISANEGIGNLTNVTFQNVSPIYRNMLIQVGFAVAILAISLVVNKRKSLDII